VAHRHATEVLGSTARSGRLQTARVSPAASRAQPAPRMPRALGDGEVGLHQAHGRPAVPRHGRCAPGRRLHAMPTSQPSPARAKRARGRPATYAGPRSSTSARSRSAAPSCSASSPRAVATARTPSTCWRACGGAIREFSLRSSGSAASSGRCGRSCAATAGTSPVGWDRDGVLANLYCVAVCPHITYARWPGRVHGTSLGTVTRRELDRRISRAVLASRRAGWKPPR